jgi:hypothetical protein
MDMKDSGLCLEEYLGVIDAEEPQDDMQEESQED